MDVPPGAFDLDYLTEGGLPGALDDEIGLEKPSSSLTPMMVMHGNTL